MDGGRRSGLLLTGLLITALLTAAAVWERAELAMAGDDVIRLEEELRLLEEERTALRLASDGRTDLEEAERYAVEVLGMTRPRRDQILCALSSLPDRVTVTERSESTLARLWKGKDGA